MARYIDTRKVTVPKGFFNKDLGVPDLLKWLEAQPAADVVPRSVITGIFAELDERLDNLMVVMNPHDGFITTFRKTMEKVTAEVEEIKKRYTEDNNDS